MQQHTIFGDDSKEVPPVPIPNTVVKLFSVLDTWRVTARERRTLPEQSEIPVCTFVHIGYSQLTNEILI